MEPYDLSNVYSILVKNCSSILHKGGPGGLGVRHWMLILALISGQTTRRLFCPQNETLSKIRHWKFQTWLELAEVRNGFHRSCSGTRYQPAFYIVTECDALCICAPILSYQFYQFSEQLFHMKNIYITCEGTASCTRPLFNR